MSKELEMLREWCELTNAPETIDLPGNRVRRASLGIDDLRRILARLEAAERVCENWIEWGDKMAAYASGEVDSGAVDNAALSTSNALRAYRDLDAPKQEKG